MAAMAAHVATRAAGRRVSLTPSALDEINGILDEVVLRIVSGARSLTHEHLRAHGVVPLLRQPPHPQDKVDASAKAGFAREVLTDAEVALKTHEANLRSTRGFAPLGLAAASRWDGNEAFPVAGAYEALRQQAWYYCTLARPHRGHGKSPSDPPAPPRDTRIPVFPPSSASAVAPSPPSPAPASSPSAPQPPPVSSREPSAFVHLTPQTSVFVGAVLAGIAKAMIAAVGESVSERTVMRSDLDPFVSGDGSGSDSDSVASIDLTLPSEQAGLMDLATALANLSSTTSSVFNALDRARKVMGLAPLLLDEHGSVRDSLTSIPAGNTLSLRTSTSTSSVYSTASGPPVPPVARTDSVGSRAGSLTSTLDDRDGSVPTMEPTPAPVPQSPAPPSSFAFPSDRHLRRRRSIGSVDSTGRPRSSGFTGKLFNLRPHSRRSSGDSADSVSIFHHIGALRSTSALSTRHEPTSAPPAAPRRSRSVRARSASSASLALRSHSRESTRDWQAPAPALDGPEFDAMLATPTVHVSLTPASLQGGLPMSPASGSSRSPSPQPSTGGSTRTRHHAPPPSSYSFRSGDEATPAAPSRHGRSSDSLAARNGRSDGLLAPGNGTRAVSSGAASDRAPAFPGATTLEIQKPLPPAISPAPPPAEQSHDPSQVGIALSTAEPPSAKSDSTPTAEEVKKSPGHTEAAPVASKPDEEADGKTHDKPVYALSRRPSLAEARRQQSNPTDAPSKVVQWGYRGGRNRQRRYSLNDVGTSDGPSNRLIGLGGQRQPPVSNVNGLKGRTSAESINATSTPVSSPATASPLVTGPHPKGGTLPERPPSSTEKRRPPSTASAGRGARSSLPPSQQQQQQQQLQWHHTLTVLEDILAQLASPGADARQLVEDKCASIRNDLRTLHNTNAASHTMPAVSQFAPTDKGPAPSAGQLRRLSLAPATTSPVRRTQQGGSQRASLGSIVARPTSPPTSAAATSASGPPHTASGTPYSTSAQRAPPTASLETARSSNTKSSASYRRVSTERTAPVSPISPGHFTGSPDAVKLDLLSSSPDPKRTSLSPMPYAPNSASNSAPYSASPVSPASPPSRPNNRQSYQNRGANRLSVWSGTSASGRTSPSLSSLAEDGDAVPNGTAALPRPASAASNYNVVRVPQAALKAQIERDRAVQSRVLASLFGAEHSHAASGELGGGTTSSLPARDTGTGDNARSRLSTISAQSVPATRPRTNTQTPSLASPTRLQQASTMRPRSNTSTEPHVVGTGISGGGGKVPSRIGNHSPLHHHSAPTNKVKAASTVFERAARVFAGPPK